MRSLVAVGACCLDTILTVPHYPHEDEKLRAIDRKRRRGGNSPNTFEVLQQLLRPATTSALGLKLVAVLPSRTSDAVAEIKASFGEGEVDLTHCIYREDHNEAVSSYILRSTSTDSRTIINYNALSEMTEEEFAERAANLGSEASWYHFEGRIPDVTLQCMRHLRTRLPSVTISVEVEKPNREGLQELAAEADVVFFSRSWAQAKGYSTAEECIRAQARLVNRAGLLFCTWGDQGACAFDGRNEALEHCPASIPENARVVDVVGAGDTFIAGMLYGLICHAIDWPLAQKLRFATELAGRKVSQEGFAGVGEKH